jgi:hypothetical protein
VVVIEVAEEAPPEAIEVEIEGAVVEVVEEEEVEGEALERKLRGQSTMVIQYSAYGKERQNGRGTA